MKIRLPSWLPQLESAFVIFVLLFATSPLTLWLGRSEQPGQGNPLTQAVWLSIYLIVFALLAFV